MYRRGESRGREKEGCSQSHYEISNIIMNVKKCGQYDKNNFIESKFMTVAENCAGSQSYCYNLQRLASIIRLNTLEIAQVRSIRFSSRLSSRLQYYSIYRLQLFAKCGECQEFRMKNCLDTCCLFTHRRDGKVRIQRLLQSTKYRQARVNSHYTLGLLSLSSVTSASLISARFLRFRLSGCYL